MTAISVFFLLVVIFSGSNLSHKAMLEYNHSSSEKFFRVLITIEKRSLVSEERETNKLGLSCAKLGTA